jgi:hypothetical protein
MDGLGFTDWLTKVMLGEKKFLEIRQQGIMDDLNKTKKHLKPIANNESKKKNYTFQKYSFAFLLPVFDYSEEGRTKSNVPYLREYSEKLAACRTTYFYSRVGRGPDQYYWSCCGSRAENHPEKHSTLAIVSKKSN